MSDNFLLNFMRMASDITRAERAFAVDDQLNVLGTLNIRPENIEAAYFRSVQKALSEGKALITDNYTMALDPSRAPVTNQSFPKLRFVLILPLEGYGAICMDQSLHTGLTSKEKVDRLSEFVKQVVRDNQVELSEEELFDLYETFSA
jgi:hypothetical protein